MNALADAYDTGDVFNGSWRKKSANGTSQGQWCDLSMCAGNPSPQYYAASPMVSVALAASTDGGIYVGSNQSPKKKWLTKATIYSDLATPLPLNLILLDYLLFYPFIDESTTDAQPVTNTVTIPRYTTGTGVQIIAVSQAARTGGNTFQITYTNQDGVAGRLTKVVTENAYSGNGNIVTCHRTDIGCAGPFIPLQAGDTGVRSIESFQMISGPDVGLLSLVLVRPLAEIQLREVTAPVEKEFFKDASTLPEIKDDAYLNHICCAIGSVGAVNIFGLIEVVYS